MSDVRQASRLLGILALSSAYGDRVTAEEEGGRRFAQLLREHRASAGLRQEDVAELSGVHLSTYSRWERGLVRNPVPEEVQAVCRVLRLSTVRAASALGYLSPEDADVLPEPPRRFDPSIEEIISLFEDPRVPEDTKRAALSYLQYLKAQTQQRGPETDNGPSRAAS